MTFDRIAVVGAGAWGSALANVSARAGRRATPIARDRAGAEVLLDRRESPRLPNIRIDERIAISAMNGDFSRQDAVLLVIPSQHIREAARFFTVGQSLTKGTPVIACAKGIERGTHKFMTEVIAASARTAVPAILSGPSFADDVARGLPAAVTLAARDESTAAALARALGSAAFRPYHSTDVRGVEIGGAAKNVLAIAAGIVAGRGLGASAAAALVTRGFAELFRFGRAFGARPETLTGLSGLGDVDSHLLKHAVAQLFLRHRLGEGPSGAGRRQARRGHFHRSGAGRDGERKGHRDAGRQRRRRHSRGPGVSVDEATESLLGTRPFRAEG